MEIIVDIAAEMLDDEAGGTGGQLACYFFCEVFNRPLPQPFKDDQAALKEVEDELMKEAGAAGSSVEESRILGMPV